MKTIYLQRRPSFIGRDSLGGRLLFDAFRRASSDSLLGHMIVSDEDATIYSKDPQLRNDVISYDLIKRFDPNVLYVEGELLLGGSTWKIARPIAEEVVGNGAVMIAADIGVDVLRRNRSFYDEASVNFFHTSIAYTSSGEPRLLVDTTSNWEHAAKEIICKADQMAISDWLRPVYTGISEIIVAAAVRLEEFTYADILASGNKSTTGLDDDPVPYPYPFASVYKYRSGYAVLIAGYVSDDYWLQACPQNGKWLTNLAEFLTHEISHDRDRGKSPWTSPFSLFLSHRSVDKKLVAAVAAEIKQLGVAIWLDAERLVPSDSLTEEIDHGLGQMTHFVIFWSQASKGAPWVERELNAAVHKLIENRLPILIVRLDNTPVPTIVADIFRIEAAGQSPSGIGAAIVEAVERLARRSKES